MPTTFKNDYHKFLERGSRELFDCGEYYYGSRFLGLTKKGVMRLPIDMYRNGLLIQGCQKSYRRRLANHYARTLVSRGVRVLYITDALSEEQYRAEFEIEAFNKHIGMSELDDSLVHIEDITGKFNRKPFDDGRLLSVVRSNRKLKADYREDQKEHNEMLLSLLNSVKESGIMNDNYKNDKPDFVVFIDEEGSVKNLNGKAFRDALLVNRIKISNFVICGYGGGRYDSVANDFEHYVFFRVKDPQTDLMHFDVFNKHRIRFDAKGCGYSYVPFLNSRDVSQLNPKEFYYTQSTYFGWSNKASFDAGGCECCKLPPEDYYRYIKLSQA